MGEDLRERLDQNYFVNQFLVGDCPKCGSPNTHDCEALTFEQSPLDPKELIRTGSDCGVAMEIDDITVGHCDDCDYLWCLECGSQLYVDSPNCTHWELCEACGRTMDFPPSCDFREEVESGELLEDPCLLGCPFIDECSRCPYTMDVRDCPTIRGGMLKKQSARAER